MYWSLRLYYFPIENLKRRDNYTVTNLKVTCLEFNLKAHPKNRIMYLPQKIFNILGTNITAVPNRTAVICYNAQTPITDVLYSLDIIQADLKHLVEIEARKTKENNPNVAER